jgi:hypothetical protein
MDSIWYGLAMVAIYFVVYWFITNDKLPEGQTTGILAMKPPAVRRGRRQPRPKFSLGDRR